jgi:asparagine synthase (glutamine-hydrolysing)
MCGIAGILDSQISSDLLETKGRQMMQSLLHRGPDEGGLWRSDACNLVLVHRRLSIQDLSANGAQPMLSSSQRYCVAFNGEIYNFKEIASDLSKRGHHFTGHSDTEVLLAAIEEWSLTGAIKRFVGMFAFALWDRKDRIIHLCRDRLGEKPLYYGWIKNSLYFASELKAIEKVVPNDQLEINHEGLSGLLKHGYISAPHSIYRYIYKLMPGTILSIPAMSDCDSFQHSPWPDEPLLSPKTYWSVLNSANQGLSNLILNENEAVEQLDEALHKTIRRQMIADVKLGTFLSGGIDSTVVSAIAQNESSEKIRTYTIGFSEKEYDESKYAEKIARHLGTDHLTMHVTPDDVLKVVPDLASIYDEPFADSSQIPSFLVSKLAREHVTVCLSGDGGDELFAGYNRYLWTQSLWGKLSPVPKPMRQLLGKALAIPPPAFWDKLYQGFSSFKPDSFEEQKLVGLKVQKLAGFMQQNDIFQAYDYLVSYWQNPANLIAQMASTQTHNLKTNYPDTNNFIDQAMYLDQIGYLPGDNLAKVDRASMAASLETRLPLLSHEVVDLAWRIPSSMKVKNDTSKWVLRKVLSKYVPEEMVNRPKMGFSVPVAKWLRGELKEWAEDLLATIDTNSGALQKKVVQRAWLEHMSGKQDHSHRLWAVLMYLSWCENRNFNKW